MTVPDDLLIETARDVFGDLLASGSGRGLDGEWAAAAWQIIAETGLTRVGVAESIGGEGGSNEDAAAILALAGEYALPLPIAENALLAGWLLTAAGLALPAGAGPVTVAPGGSGDDLRLQRSVGGWTVEGTLHRVPWAEAATHLVALAASPEHPGSYVTLLIPRPLYVVRAGQNLAGERRDTVTLERIELPADGVVPTPATPDGLLRRGAISRAVLIAGALRRLLTLTVGFANVRVQFGRPIAKFQAVGQLLARLAEEVALAETASTLGVNSLEEAAFDAGIAKSSCGRAAGAAARIAHQVHGAIGVTEEYELQRLTRRLLSWRDEYGAESRWEANLGAALLESGPQSAWDTVIGARPSLAETTGSPQ